MTLNDQNAPQKLRMIVYFMFIAHLLLCQHSVFSRADVRAEIKSLSNSL